MNPVRMSVQVVAFSVLLASRAEGQRERWRSVSVGSDHAWALDGEGRAFCWGWNHAGQLGARTAMECGIQGESGHRGCHTAASETAAVPVGGDVRFTTLSAGEYRTCGIDRGGAAFCWGAPLGGDAGYTDRCTNEERCSFTPVPLLPGRRFAILDARALCAADAQGQALCWGSEYRTSATVRKPWGDRPIAFVAGDTEEKVFCALGRDGRAICRAEPDFGIRGNGPAASADEPVDAPARFLALGVLGTWACGLDAAGTALCWGAAGYDDVRGHPDRPGDEQCVRWAVTTWCNRRPAPVRGGLRFRSIAPYPRGTLPRVNEMMGLTADGRAFAWGGDRRPRPWHPEQRWASVSTGRWGECGITTAGALFCWGMNPHDGVHGRIPHP